MRRIIVVVGVAVLMTAAVALTASTALAQAETMTLQEQSTTEGIIENPCTGEEIQFEGTYHSVQHTTLTEKGYHAVSRANTTGIVGTGLETGDTYRFVNPGGFAAASLANGMHVTVDEGTQIIISDGPAPNYLLHFLVKGTEDVTDGQPSMRVEVWTVGCTPEVETTTGAVP